MLAHKHMRISTTAASKPLQGTPTRNVWHLMVSRPAEVGTKPRNVKIAISRKEVMESRRYRRTVADPEWWSEYLTEDRFLKNIGSLFNSRIIRHLYGPLTSVALTATIVCVYETLRSEGVLPPEFPSICMPNQTPLNLTGFAVSLLLVFRTNQSYDRWWEARKVWGTILNRVRDITTQAAVFIPEDEPRLREGIRNWAIAFTRTLEAHLQGKLVERDLKSNLENTLSPYELDMVMNSQHKVVKCCSVLAELALQAPINSIGHGDEQPAQGGQVLQRAAELALQAPINSIERQMLQHNVQVFYDTLGMCERIMRTPLPLTYTRHSSRFLFVYINALPFAMYSAFGWGCIPITIMISALLLGIDEIGVQIEEPFGVLPLDAICTRAEIDMRSIIKEQPDLAEYVRGLRSGSAATARTVPAEVAEVR
eukprot:CAMPEP_0202391448 /NCGR_PEP_ID=MMETSP1127-20130417/91840_1 /ASSEMBLY_ACC=CAM_ASM_000462 /TAXON_ID=3047 /ORGANISM="Dunaliella tertiolecta, Strain CCMP1320" /LENGTH=423 /DNA_ID=CAMNT_0048993877 /DNA_START=37 /DNA_END=1309 /DNA_ORIENTATION=+